MWSLLLWGVTQCSRVVSYQCYGTACWSRLQRVNQANKRQSLTTNRCCIIYQKSKNPIRTWIWILFYIQ